jgi:hypothetical protein
VNKDVESKFTKQCKLVFGIRANFINEIEVVVSIPLDVRNVVFGSPYMYVEDVIFMRRETNTT